MNVKTRFEPQRGLQEDTKKRGRRHASLHDSSSDEERPADVASIMGANIYKQAMAIATQKQNEKKESASSLPEAIVEKSNASTDTTNRKVEWTNKMQNTTPPQEKEPRQDIGETEAHLPQLHDTTHFHQDTVMQADAIEATLLPRISEAMVRDLQALGKDVDKDKKVKKVEKVKKDLLPPIPFLLVTRVKIWSNGGHVRPGLANENTEGTRATKKNATTTWPTKQHTHTYGHSEDATSFILQKARKVNGSWDAKPPPEARFSS